MLPKTDDIPALLNYHLQECQERYRMIEKRLSRMELALWTMIAGLSIYGSRYLATLLH
jgi:hypothetical protein